MGGHAGAALRRACLRGRGKPTLACARAERSARKRVGWPATCWRRRSMRCRSSPAETLACSAWAWRPPFCGAARPAGASSPSFEQRYELKNAADQVMRTEFTQAHRTALERLAESVFTDAVEAIAQGRGLDPAIVRGLVDGVRACGPGPDANGRRARLRDQAHAAIARPGGRGRRACACRSVATPPSATPTAASSGSCRARRGAARDRIRPLAARSDG